MKVITPSFEILHFDDDALDKIERAARICYLSEPKNETSEEFVRRLIIRGHHTPLEMSSVTVKIVCDKGVLGELTRHRLASFNAESTRYVNYSKKGLTFIKPSFWDSDSVDYALWECAMQDAEKSYNRLIANGATPEQARSVLPMSLKTELVLTCNLREWLHIFNLRCSKKSHPQLREIMLPMLKEFYDRLLVVFEDIYKKYFGNDAC